jgi:hypothetical protein
MIRRVASIRTYRRAENTTGQMSLGPQQMLDDPTQYLEKDAFCSYFRPNLKFSDSVFIFKHCVVLQDR